MNSTKDTRRAKQTLYIQNKEMYLYGNFAHPSKPKHLFFFTLQTPRLCTIGEDVIDEYRCVAVLSSDCAMLTVQ